MQHPVATPPGLFIRWNGRFVDNLFLFIYRVLYFQAPLFPLKQKDVNSIKLHHKHV